MVRLIFWIASFVTAVLLIFMAVRGSELWFCLGSLIYVITACVLFWLNSKKSLSKDDATVLSLDEEKVLKLIHQKRQAQRSDILPYVDVSKSTLVRILDKLEEKKLIRQVGEGKATYYEISEIKPA